MEGKEAEGVFKDPIVSDLPFVGCASERVHGCEQSVDGRREGYCCKHRFFGLSKLIEAFL
ncbi:hypothetical protein BYT27DRAFT_7204585 [Phlegmacium glaucopus]|nr:hypothetical protein BYT27DRAFT_7204585 [Phlegmacium glaucopus]